MTQKSFGKMHRTRRSMKIKSSDRKSLSITRYLMSFKIGERIIINILPSAPFPHPMFHGKHGKIIDKKGRSYVVEIKDLNAVKKITLRPEHLRRVK